MKALACKSRNSQGRQAPGSGQQHRAATGSRGQASNKAGAGSDAHQRGDALKLRKEDRLRSLTLGGEAAGNRSLNHSHSYLPDAELERGGGGYSRGGLALGRLRGLWGKVRERVAGSVFACLRLCMMLPALGMIRSDISQSLSGSPLSSTTLLPTLSCLLLSHPLPSPLPPLPHSSASLSCTTLSPHLLSVRHLLGSGVRYTEMKLKLHPWTNF